MDSRTVEYIVAVAETGHFGAAARRCHVSPSTLSIQIKAIEGLLGVPLFDRQLHPVALTREGRQLLPYFTEIATAVKSLRRCAAYMSYTRGLAASGAIALPTAPAARH